MILDTDIRRFSNFHSGLPVIAGVGKPEEYDQFIGKWIAKRKERRATDPNVQARKAKRQSTDSKGLFLFKKKPSSAQTTTQPEQNNPASEPSIKNSPTPVLETGTDEIRQAMQDAKEELGVKQEIEKLKQEEEAKTEGIQKKVAQEDIKTETMQAKAKMMGTGKILIIVVGLGLAAVAATLAFKSKPEAVPVPAIAN